MRRNILFYLDNSAERYPEKIGAADEHSRCTYRELKSASERIGTGVAKLVPGREPIVVFMDKGIDALSAFLGIARAGCFYSMFNPEFPKSRLLQMQSVLRGRYIITDANNFSRGKEIFGSEKVLLIDELNRTSADVELLAERLTGALDTDPLYVNFTSGSTGVPKGVAVSQGSVVDFIDEFVPLFGFCEEDVIGNQAPFDFDVSVKDIYSALKTGATLVIIPRRLFSQPAALLDYLCDNKVTAMIWAVSALCLISTFHGLDYRNPETVNKILFSGEVMPKKHLDSWMSHLPKAEFVNLYGPTEITCNCTYHRIQRDREYPEGIPIGRAFPNEKVFLLDENDREVTAPGQTGEICVKGTALALGYYRCPEQTAKAFPQNPLNDCYPERIYRTGDLGRFNEVGELVFEGRKDFQVKYMGHRIELEEIERAISRVEGVERCCVLFEEKRQRLLGFYQGTTDKTTLHKILKETLPVHMIPGTLRQLDHFPLTKNGKIDRKQLLERKSQHAG